MQPEQIDTMPLAEAKAQLQQMLLMPEAATVEADLYAHFQANPQLLTDPDTYEHLRTALLARRLNVVQAFVEGGVNKDYVYGASTLFDIAAIFTRDPDTVRYLWLAGYRSQSINVKRLAEVVEHIAPDVTVGLNIEYFTAYPYRMPNIEEEQFIMTVLMQERYPEAQLSFEDLNQQIPDRLFMHIMDSHALSWNMKFGYLDRMLSQGFQSESRQVNEHILDLLQGLSKGRFPFVDPERQNRIALGLSQVIEPSKLSERAHAQYIELIYEFAELNQEQMGIVIAEAQTHVAHLETKLVRIAAGEQFAERWQAAFQASHESIAAAIVIYEKEFNRNVNLLENLQIETRALSKRITAAKRLSGSGESLHVSALEQQLDKKKHHVAQLEGAQASLRALMQGAFYQPEVFELASRAATEKISREGCSDKICADLAKKFTARAIGEIPDFSKVAYQKVMDHIGAFAQQNILEKEETFKALDEVNRMITVMARAVGLPKEMIEAQADAIRQALSEPSITPVGAQTLTNFIQHAGQVYRLAKLEATSAQYEKTLKISKTRIVAGIVALGILLPGTGVSAYFLAAADMILSAGMIASGGISLSGLTGYLMYLEATGGRAAKREVKKAISTLRDSIQEYMDALPEMPAPVDALIADAGPELDEVVVAPDSALKEKEEASPEENLEDDGIGLTTFLEVGRSHGKAPIRTAASLSMDSDEADDLIAQLEAIVVPTELPVLEPAETSQKNTSVFEALHDKLGDAGLSTSVRAAAFEQHKQEMPPALSPASLGDPSPVQSTSLESTSSISVDTAPEISQPSRTKVKM